MRTQARWTERVPDNESGRAPVTDLCYSPAGDQVVVGAGTRVLVYAASTGNLLHSLRGHKDTVYCVAYSGDGKRFSSGGADKTVVIWTSKGDGVLKYQHQDSVLSLAYNPVTQQLVSTAASDFGLWSVEQKNVVKHKVPSRATCCAWSSDGQHLVIGMFNGTISIRNAAGEEKAVVRREAPVWTIAFSPFREEGHPRDTFAVGSWDQKLSFYAASTGKPLGKEISLSFDPTCVSYFADGSYMLLSGSDRKVGLYSREGNFLVSVAESNDWIWAAKQRPKHFFVSTAANDGIVSGVELNITTVHSIYQDYYVFRENLTNVVVQHLSTDKKLVIKTGDYVRKVAMYKNRAAVQLSDRITVYDITPDEQMNMRYKEREVVCKKFECSLLCVTASLLILCLDRRLTSYDFSGVKRREWVMDSAIRYIKVVGGLAERESLLVGLKNGLVAKIFVDNSFPMVLVKLDMPVRCLDLSASRAKLAVVDDNNTLRVYALSGKGKSELLFQEINATAVAWNTDYEEMLCYCGGGVLNIKTGNLAPYQQNLQGFVVGFKGNKVFTLHSATMHTIDVPHSHALYRYVEKKEFESAYRVACLGVTDGDWKMLGMHALSGLNLDIARKAFIRIKEVKLVELLNRIELERRASKNSVGEEAIVLGDILAFQGRYPEAAACFIRCNQENKAIEMYSDLRMWDEARGICSSKEHLAELMRRQAQWAEMLGDYEEAAKLALASRDYGKAIRLLGEQGQIDKLMEVCRALPRTDTASINECAKYFRTHGAMTYAMEAYERIGDTKGLLQLYVAQGMWNEAFKLQRLHPQLGAELWVPWALWLATHDRFDEAQEAFKKAGRPVEALRISEQLAGNSIVTKRFGDAGYYFIKLAAECGAVQFGERPPSANEWGGRIQKFHQYIRQADLYYAYNIVYRYISQPFTNYEQATIFNASKYLLAMLSTPSEEIPVNISKVDVLLSLSKLSAAMELNWVARSINERLQQYVLPIAQQEQLDVATLSVRGKALQDKQEQGTNCSRCGQAMPPLLAPGDRCTNCFHPFVRSFVSFEPLPLVEFVLTDDLTDTKAEQIILAGIGKKPKTIQEFSALHREQQQLNPRKGADIISFNDEMVNYALNSQGGGLGGSTAAEGGDDSTQDPFSRQLVQMEFMGRDTSGVYTPFTCNAAMLKQFRTDEIFVVKGSKLAPGLKVRNKYYRLMIQSIGVTLCEYCQHFFLDEEYEFETMRGNGCPLCRFKPETK